MILLRARLSYLFHFQRPALSSLSSFKDLEAVMQRRLLANIKQVNASRLKHYNFVEEAAQHLRITPAAAQEVAHRTLRLTVVNARTQKWQDLEVKMDQNLTKLPLDPKDFGFPFAEQRQILEHFTEGRGVAKFEELNDYEWDDRTLRIFNLPDNINEQDILVTLKSTDLKVTFKYCVIGLPAFAKVEFKDAPALRSCLEKLPSRQIQFGERVAQIRSKEDEQRLRLGNRRLSIAVSEEKKLEEAIIEMSKHGRVMHVEWPVEVWMNPTLEEVKQHYKNSSELVKINQIYSDGTIESEYFPALKAWENWEDERDEVNIIDRAQKLKDSYENRTRFAKNLNIYVGKEHKLIAKNKGYCVVTYSTYEEGQSFYFSQGAYEQIQLVGDRLDFEIDSSFRKELLRQIDNEYLVGKKSRWQEKEDNPSEKLGEYKDFSDAYEKLEAYEEDEMDENESKENIAYSILMKMYRREAETKTPEEGYGVLSYLLEDNEFIEWENHLHRMKTAKNRSDKKTFDELAELELYGRVLPKASRVEKIKVEDATYVPNTKDELVRDNFLLNNSMGIYARNKFYDRQRERNNRLSDEAEGIVHTPPVADEEIPEIEGDAAAVMDADADGSIGKAGFSTHKPASLYRKRTAEEQAHYFRRLFHFTRSTIYEYMGIFQDKTIEEVVDHKAQVLNPQAIKWPNGSPYLTEQELTTVLQFRRDFQAAQDDYESYILGNEFIKSAGINIDKLRANFKEYESAALQHITDVGVVEEIKKVKGSDLEKKVGILNAQVAEFGEEYRLEKGKGDEAHLLKMRKLEHLLPLDRVEHLEKFIAEHGSDVTEGQSTVFHKYFTQMKEKDSIPD
jgi:hypothetical protein